MDTGDNKESEALREKEWLEIKSSNSWTLFRILGEFVDGFEKLEKIGPCVSLYGSARTKPGTPHYELAEEIAINLVKQGYGVITGAGPGIMEAGNKGAQQSNGKSVGLHIKLDFEPEPNAFVDTKNLISFKYFFVRKVTFVKYSQGFIVMPGGMGTLDELFEAINLVKTYKIAKFPIVLVDSAYWKDLVVWLRNKVYQEYRYIENSDFDLFHVVDSARDAVQIINDFYEKYGLKPNF
ncbi:MAG: TIGR00730 family Rossman fold protein [Bacteroidota bacterium]